MQPDIPKDFGSVSNHGHASVEKWFRSLPQIDAFRNERATLTYNSAALINRAFRLRDDLV